MIERDTYSGGVQTQRLYASYDANYDMTSLVNTSGSVVERYLYDPYGDVTYLTSMWTPLSGSQYAWRYLFQGGRFDTTTSWYDFRNRDYIPAEGRWAERDPLGSQDSQQNLYEYLVSSPSKGSSRRDLPDTPLSWCFLPRRLTDHT